MITLLLTQQIVVLFLMMACGFCVVRLGLLQPEDSRVISVLCIYIILPCVMIHSFQIEYSDSIRDGFFLAIGAAVLVHILLFIWVGITGKFLHFSPVEKTSLIYSNAGNLVIPLVTAVLGAEWVIYASAFLCVQTILIWTHGQSVMEQRAGVNWKKIFGNINLIASVVGIALFFLQIPLPGIVGDAVGNLASTVGPVSMVMLGMTMANTDWKQIFSGSRIYVVTLLKMVGSPLVILLFLKYSPLKWAAESGQMILLITLLAVITPSATTIVQLAQLYNREPEYASTINVVTTAVSIVTMPLMVMLYML